METKYLLVVLDIYGVIVTAALLAYWLTRRWAAAMPQLAIVVLAALATGAVWEALVQSLGLFNLGQGSLQSYGFRGFGQHILLPLIHVAITAILALPAAFVASIITRCCGTSPRGPIA